MQIPINPFELHSLSREELESVAKMATWLLMNEILASEKLSKEGRLFKTAPLLNRSFEEYIIEIDENKCNPNVSTTLTIHR